MAEAFYRWESKGGAPFLSEIASTENWGENEFDLHDGPELAVQFFLCGEMTDPL